MITLTNLQRLLCVTACALSLSACVTKPPMVQNVATNIEEAMAQASLASNAGQKAKALTLLKEAAAAFPANKAPWLQMAQTNYDAGQYGQAIIDAQEVLVRDPSDKLANSIVAISGLRLSTRALSDLSRQNNLSGSLRTESQDLAKLLRESLGETVLVPQREKPAARGASRKTAAKAAAAAAAAATATDERSSANPFGALK